jgi:hypothetical protein
MRRWVLALLLAATPAVAAPRPPVLVAIVIDQFPAWAAVERVPLLPKDGGFARLRREGTWVEELRYEHAGTTTAPGHAALFTGAPPSVSGIDGNELLDEKTRERVSFFEDAATQVLASDGPRQWHSSSLKRLKAQTLADRLRARFPAATIIALSLKDRAALLGGGRKPDAAIWIDLGVGRFSTSTAVARSFPEWAQPIVGADLLRRLMDRRWSCLDPLFCARAGTPDEQPGESDLGGWGTSFPHLLGNAADPGAAFRGSPFADEVLLQLAGRALDGARRDQPILLVVSLSANDFIGHLFGPDSWEAWDELRRLDGELGRFFGELDRRFGANGWAAMLTSDHGAISMPEAAQSSAVRPWCRPGAPPDRWARPCGASYRLVSDELRDELQAAAAQALGGGELIAGVAEPYVFFGRDGEQLEPARRAELVRVATRIAMRHPAIERVFDVRALPRECPPASDESVEALVCRAVAPGTDGDLYLVPKPGSFFDPNYVIGFGSGHGAPYLYDRTVSLFVRAPGRVRAGEVLHAPLSVQSFARTAASLLGIDAPPAVQAGIDLTRR